MELFRKFVMRFFAGVGIAACAAVLLGVVFVSQSLGQRENAAIYRQLELFGDVFQRVREDYVDETEAADLVHNALDGMLSALDPHSSYLSGEEFAAMRERTRGEFGGVGIEITMEDGLIKVISPIDDTPAARAGILAGDYIIRIGKTEVLGLGQNEAVDMMRGPAGTDITITVKRAGVDPFDLTITRAKIPIRAVRQTSYGNIGYIRITTFSERTTPGLKQALRELRREHDGEMKGIVLDLRNNPGGLLNEAIDVTDTFLDRGEIVSTRGRHERDTSRVYAKAGDATDGLPMVVLINSGSASASEIVAGALKDHERALVMGTRSFGKGSVQSVIPLGREHGAIRLTTARYYTPSGVSIQGEGIAPDIVVEAARVVDDTIREVREENLAHALENTDDNPADDNPADDNPAAANDNDDGAEEEAPIARSTTTDNINDYQLARAVDLLRGVSVFNKVVQ